jgi:chitodextrinase
MRVAFRTLPAQKRFRFCILQFAFALLFAGCTHAPANIPIVDTTPPTAPTNLTTTAVSPAQINLSWTSSTDNVAVTGYKVERCLGNSCANFAQIATPSGTTFNDAGLTGSTSYSYRVRAADAAGNLSSYSVSSAVTTPAPTFTAPTNLSATAVSSTQINLTWTAGSETGGTISQYLVERCQGAGCSNFTQVATSASASFGDSGLTAATSYSYRVRATDNANNLSGYSNTATATTSASGSNISVTITPHQGGVVTGQALGVVATVKNDLGNAGVTWTTSGGALSGQTTSAATFSSGAAGSFTIKATSNANNAVSATATVGVTNLSGVFTYHNDLARDGVNSQEFALTPSNVQAGSFGKLFGCAVDGEMYAQPLWVANLAIGGGTHNVVFAATENDGVFAFDADTSPCKQYWMKSLLPPGAIPIPPGDTGEAFDINTMIGITGTPVIDPATQTLYVVAKTKEGSSNYHQRLHALSLIDGSEKFSGPVDLTQAITVSGTGDQGDGSTCTSAAGKVPFCPLKEGQRAGLAFVNGNVYVTWASHGDNQPYHGWIMAFNAANLQQPPVLFNDSPNGIEGGIWMSGGAPAFDSSNNIFVITGNGDYDGVTEFGESILKLNSSLTLQDWFSPNVQPALDQSDLDLGAGGAVVLVDLPGSTVPHILIGGGKGVNQSGTMYVVNRDTGSMGHQANPDKSVQQFNLDGMIYSTAAFWQNTMYIAAVNQQLVAYALNPATSQFAQNPSSQSAHFFFFPGATPSVSSNGTTNGIVWALDTDNTTAANASGSAAPAILFAYDATNLNNELWDSTQGTGNAAGNAVKFCVPVIANGKVYVGTKTELSVYGLLP